MKREIEPLDRFLKMIRWIRFCVAFCGNDVADPNFRMWWLTYLVLGAIGFFFVCTGYTIYVGVVVDGDFTVILQAMALVGSAVQGLSKLLSTANLATLLRNMQNTYEDIYREYGLKGGEYKKCLKRRIEMTWRLMWAFMFVYAMSVSIMVCFPIVYLIIFHKKIMVMQFLVPFIDQSTDSGYMMLSALHVCLMAFGGFGNFGGDMYLFLFITNLPLMKDIFCVKLKELNAAIAANQKNQFKSMLADLIAWHQKYQSILLATRRIYSIVLFVQLATTCTGILCTIACIFIRAWPAAPCYLLLCVTLLYSFCALGTVVENSNEDLTREIYSGCVWYDLPVREEKVIILMLAKAQKEPNLSAADMMPLSMTTALQLTKGIYSFSMMMLTYLGFENI
ncbi:hypothetical protein KR018_005270 [Drosophila ironensis]|nr:hypothetical protein KR018_005270 [Drosophila ironensis]